MHTSKSAIKFLLLFTVLTGVIYPLLVTGLAQLLMPYQANGSLLVDEERIVGSLLIAQSMQEPHYFWPRPSAIDYDPLKPSGGSNLGPISKTLKDLVAERRQRLGEKAPSDLLYASGSGLDPHISLEAAYFQIPRVAEARMRSPQDLRRLVDSLVEGNGYVNVLQLNWTLDRLP